MIKNIEFDPREFLFEPKKLVQTEAIAKKQESNKSKVSVTKNKSSRNKPSRHSVHSSPFERKHTGEQKNITSFTYKTETNIMVNKSNSARERNEKNSSINELVRSNSVILKSNASSTIKNGMTNWKPKSSIKKADKLIRLVNERIVFTVERYEKLKAHVNEAIAQRKIFTLYGNCYLIRNALLRRGWVEKLTNRLFDKLKRDLPYSPSDPKIDSKKERLVVNTLLTRTIPYFIWNVSSWESTINNKNLTKWPLINNIKLDDKYFTTKAGLCSALKFQHWFNINGVSDVCSPRSYNIFDGNEMEDFSVDYKITACAGLLKWFIKCGEANMSEAGKMPISIINFALMRCRTYIQRRMHKDIDNSMKEPKATEWDEFIDKYRRLINRKARLKLVAPSAILLYTSSCNEIINYMKNYIPETDCEGFSDVWIVKPGCWSRGRGITVTNDLRTILSMSQKKRAQRCVVQKYIEVPLLIFGAKFDIRQYYVITNTHPLIIWMYKKCYFKISSQDYTLANFSEAIHLTNWAVQHRYKHNKRRDPNLPNNNMWSLQQFREYLVSVGKENVWEQVIYKGMKKNIIGAMLNCQDGMINRINQFELYGCDFLLDHCYKPWLIEINSGPDMSSSTSVTAKLCPQVLEDLIKVVVDHKRDPNALTGDFECIYKQKMTQPIYSTDISSLIVLGENSKMEKLPPKLHKVFAPQYKEATTDEHLRASLPWKHELIEVKNRDEINKFEGANSQYDSLEDVNYSEDSNRSESNFTIVDSSLSLQPNLSTLDESMVTESEENLEKEKILKKQISNEKLVLSELIESITGFDSDGDISVSDNPTDNNANPFIDLVISDDILTRHFPKNIEKTSLRLIDMRKNPQFQKVSKPASNYIDSGILNNQTFKPHRSKIALKIDCDTIETFNNKNNMQGTFFRMYPKFPKSNYAIAKSLGSIPVPNLPHNVVMRNLPRISNYNFKGTNQRVLKPKETLFNNFRVGQSNIKAIANDAKSRKAPMICNKLFTQDSKDRWIINPSANKMLSYNKSQIRNCSTRQKKAFSPPYISSTRTQEQIQPKVNVKKLLKTYMLANKPLLNSIVDFVTEMSSKVTNRNLSVTSSDEENADK